MAKKLYNRPTVCVEPARLHGKMWDEISTRDFACKPYINTPDEFVFGTPGRNATLSCQITGSPRPQGRWVVNGRIVNNNTNPVPFSDQKWLLYEEDSINGIQRWYNLTITNAGYDNLGDYLCVAENNGGVMEKSVTLTFDDPTSLNAGLIGLTAEEWTIVIGVITASLLFIALMVALVCCCCFCRQQKNANKTKDMNPTGGGGKNNPLNQHMSSRHHREISAYENQADQSHQRLLTPSACEHAHSTPRVGEYQCLPAPQGVHHAHHSHSHGGGHSHYGEMTELTDMRSTPSVISSNKGTSDSSRASFEGVASFVGPPDLIHHHAHYGEKKTSTPLSVSTLMSHQLNGSHHRVSPSPSGSGHFHRSGTLPLHYGYAPHGHGHAHPRSVSCDHTSQTLRLTPQPPKLPKQSLQHHQRPGYVTLPRRPRASWSAPPRDTPMYAVTMKRPTNREPIYDGVGPRTSADGSSMGTLPRTSKSGTSSPATPISNGKYSLGPYYAPIEELAEGPATPLAAKKEPSNNSSSEITLTEESISSYCEPFGKAQMLIQQPNHETPRTPNMENGGNNKRFSMTSAESELEALIVMSTNGQNVSNGGGSLSQNGQNGGSSERSHSSGGSSTKENNNNAGNYRLQEDSILPPMMPLLPPIMTSNQGIGETAFNSSENENGKKIGPKTLPKPPKVRPLPPPKPTKSAMSSPRAVMFQDEGADGSEV